MDGVLETAITLGFCKVGCSLLSLTTLRSHLSAVGLCCSCLLLFTDLGVTAFLALLWLAGGSRLPPTSTPSDVIALRFLLFLGQAYGTALLLTAPLITVEMVYKMRRPRGRGCVGHQRISVALAGGDMEDGSQEAALVHGGAFLSCLVIWVVCGLRGGFSAGLDEQHAKACMLRMGSLSTCLPDMPAITLAAVGDPALALFGPALLLALALSMSLPRSEPTQSGTVAVHPGYLPPISLCAPDAAGSTSKTSESAVPQHVTVMLGHSSRSLQMAVPLGHMAQGADMWGWVTSCLRGRVLTGLACGITLYLFPPSISVNVVLIRYLEALAEWTLSPLLSLSREDVAVNQLLLLTFRRDASTGLAVQLMETAIEA
ncbi:uncharacterized protein LOC125748085 isoform X2 [Brienomyrus brachyistius]|nr:uncharacterized protein LOC125748085 isoform X2 [Brienomyrus brachyistius]XP_048879857.1 uncharacterized protein LOC125748085 isoform X2 [Brienomyrus brachyistius]XP_048879858.1 uncharacterized protein LOC125748085 isoform X2 [Brienomyrus brachyistius]XP_048879859.1 uncharacterized protein LOC125748085 isoform X2 [Brienomyrus brachyistius]